MASKLVCWSCGEPVKGVPRRITRFTRCPVCRVDLHVCRLCRHYDPGILGECRHERAERVVDKEQANFCTYFRPRTGAHTAPADPAADSSRAALDALFGLGGEDAGASKAKADPKAAAKRAREELDALFDLEKGPDSPNGDSSG
jgi:hypothetical protein